MAQLRLFLAAIAFTACASEPPPVSPVAATEPAPVASSPAPVASTAPATVCLPAAAAKGEVVHVDEQSGKLRACFLDEKAAEGASYASPGQTHPCVFVDLETGNLASAPPYKVADHVEAKPPALTVTSTTDSVKVCKGAQCKSVKVAVKPAPKAKATTKPVANDKKTGKKGTAPAPDAPQGLSAVVDDGMTKVFVFVPESAKDGSLLVFGETFDLASGKRTSRVPLTGVVDGVFVDPSNTWSGTWLGNRLVLRDQVCCGPGAAVVLVDPVKGTMKHVHGYAGSLTQHEPTKAWYALREKELIAVDPDAMTMTPIVAAPGAALDPEAESATWLPVGNRIAFVYANPPGFAVVDPATKKAGPTRPIAVCAP